MLNLRIKRLALGLPVSAGLVLRDRVGCCGRRGVRDVGLGRRAALLLRNRDLLIKRQAVGHVGNAFYQRTVLTARGLRPERAAAVGLAQVNRPGLRAQRQPTDG